MWAYIIAIREQPYIVKFHEGFEDENTVWLVIEYVSGGDLLDFVINKGGLSTYGSEGQQLRVFLIFAELMLNRRI